jgi:hypothetical protein
LRGSPFVDDYGVVRAVRAEDQDCEPRRRATGFEAAVTPRLTRTAGIQGAQRDQLTVELDPPDPESTT